MLHVSVIELDLIRLNNALARVHRYMPRDQVISWWRHYSVTYLGVEWARPTTDTMILRVFGLM